MNKDTKFIFEAYLNKKVVLEAPIYADDLGYTGDIEKAPGKGYGIGKAAARENKSKTEIANQLLSVIKTKLFKPEAHTVDGKEYQLYYPGSKMKFRAELENLIKNELKLGATEARYTARVVDNLLNVLRVDVEGGAVANPVQVKQAVNAGVEGKSTDAQAATSVATSAAPSSEKTFVKNSEVRFIKEWQPIFVELPDEITVSKGDLYDSPELRNEVIEAITRAFDATKAKDKELVTDFIDSLKYKNSYISAEEAKQKEGEGTGEEPTIEDYPEEDEPTSIARELGYKGGRSFDEFDKYSTI